MTDAEEQAARDAAGGLADRCVDTCGGGLRAVLLHGSLATGGFRPGRSDMDLLVVVDDGLTGAQAASTEDAVRSADLGTAAGIDLHVVTAAVARAPSREPELELHVGRHSGGVEVARRLRDPDLLAELSMARGDGLALVGPPPDDVVGPVPPEWIVERGHHWLTRWLSLTDDTDNAAFMVLTACRMWRFALEHVHSSKPDAAAWALDRDPSLDVVRQALLQCAEDVDAPVDEPGIAALLDRVLRETRGESLRA